MNNKKNDIDIFQKYLKSEEKYIKIIVKSIIIYILKIIKV